MAQRRYGPTRGAGVVVIEQEGGKILEPAALGWVGYAAMFRKGPVNQLSLMTSKEAFLRRYGSYHDDGQGPDACIDFFDAANGRGGIAVVRVTDGDEVAASATLYSRKVSGTSPTKVAMGTVAAKNGGRWGGQEKYFTKDLSAIGKLAETTLDTETSMVKDEWKGGYIALDQVPLKTYPITGNTTAGVISVLGDQTMLTDHGGGGGDKRYYLVRENDGEELTVVIEDGEDNPTTEFALTLYVDGVLFKKWPNLHTDPTNARYWVSLINNDDYNDQITVTDAITGTHTADSRPANTYGIVDSCTQTVLTAKIHRFTITAPVSGGNPTCALGVTTDTHKPQTITITMTDPTHGTPVSDRFGQLGDVAASLTLGAAYTPNNKWTPPFTITAGATPLAAADVLTIYYMPFTADELIGGYLYPDKVNYKTTKYRITDNDHKTITVGVGNDMTAQAVGNDQYMVVSPTHLVAGIDGHASILDSDYEKAFLLDSSPFNQIADNNNNLGLIKLAAPGVTATAVQKAGVVYAEGRNYQFRYECPSGTVTDIGAMALVNDTLGRSDFAVMSFPSYGYVPDPLSTDGKLNLRTLTGQIHGREAAIAGGYNGYHKAEAGIDAKLTKCLKLPTGDVAPDHELLNPVGISVIIKRKGNFVIWGDRTLYIDPNWKWKHQRELMSHYEHTLQESFDWIVFAINDPVLDGQAKAALREFFKPEFAKRAIRGTTVDDAAVIKVDSENNTDSTRATGDNFADISLRLADTVERFNMRIGKQGIFESVS